MSTSSTLLFISKLAKHSNPISGRGINKKQGGPQSGEAREAGGAACSQTSGTAAKTRGS